MKENTTVLVLMPIESLKKMDLKAFEWEYLEKLYTIENEQEWKEVVNRLRSFTKLSPIKEQQ